MPDTEKPSPLQSDISDDDLMEEVATWLVRMSGDDCTEADRQAFAKWQAQSPRHQACVNNMQATLDQFQSIQNSPSADISNQLIEEAISDANTQYPFNRKFVIILISGLLLCMMGWQILPTQQWLADTRNRHDAWTVEILNDHSEIKISGATAYNIDFDDKQRLIKLLNGNILVDVAKDASRPFVIQTEYARITALGTRFMVQHHEHATILTMLESSTRVEALHDQQVAIELSAGQQIIIDVSGLHKVQSVSSDLIESAWNKRLFVAHQMPLDQVLDQLQSYQGKTLVYDPQALQHITVNATLALDASALDLLEQSLPIQIRTTMLGRLEITPKNK